MEMGVSKLPIASSRLPVTGVCGLRPGQAKSLCVYGFTVLRVGVGKFNV